MIPSSFIYYAIYDGGPSPDSPSEITIRIFYPDLWFSNKLKVLSNVDLKGVPP
jgi:hypothetical protein